MSFESEISKVFGEYDIPLTEKQIEQFYNYYKLIVLWNKKMNLTAITTQKDVIIKHFLDSVLPFNEIKENARIIDIGTGAGFPGIPLKIMRDDIEIVLVDALKKRTLFLVEVVETLELNNVFIVHERSEILAQNLNYRDSFDYCVSRAVAPLNTLVEYCAPFVNVFGFIIAYKSLNANTEVEASKNAFKILGLKLVKSETVEIKEIGATRTFLHIRKNNKTPMAYPRQQNKPKTDPL